MMRRARIHERLETLVGEGIIRDFYVQGNMPGLRWTLLGRGWDRTYTTVEIEAFLDGVALGHRTLVYGR
jgi:hypothetical protein